MEYPRKVGKIVSMSSSEESMREIYLSYEHLILQDPRIKLEFPTFVIIDCTSMKINFKPLGQIFENSMRRGLALIRVMAHLNDPELSEWTHSIKVVSESLNNLSPLTKTPIQSSARWRHILQFISRSRRFVTWIKIMRQLPLLGNEFPGLRKEAKLLFDQIKLLMVGKSNIAKKDLKKWDEDMRKIPTKIN
jgi:hypothetical protein